MKHFLDESAECERCGRMDRLNECDGQMVCYDCREELARAAWSVRHETPLSGDMALLYSDDQPAC